VSQVFLEQGDQPFDSSSVAALEIQLQRKLRGQVHDLKVLPRGQGLALQGYAYTYYAKQLAQHALMSATSLPLLKNEISVI
jgi:hypothetical protein